MPIEYVDGPRFRQVVIAGAQWVRHTREHLNRINVFPVADGDTGTNLALSLSATASALRAHDARALSAAAECAAEASIANAKGNSGTIMAHWFLGLAHAFKHTERANVSDVSAALGRATEEVYSGIDKPVEGTVISVMRAVSDAALGWQGRGDLGAMMESLLSAAHEALARTPEQLAVLKRAKVVDAGAQGYVNFLEGAVRTVRGEPAPAFDDSDFELSVDAANVDHDGDIDGGRFCTEVVVRGRRFNAQQLRALFRPHGTSMLVVSTGRVFKLHIHTDHPDEVIRLAAEHGNVEERKVDDMALQSAERSAKLAPLVPLAEQGTHVAIVCDSTADIDIATRRSHGIEMAPLQVLFGDEVFRDQVDLSSDEFYAKLDSHASHPSTSQPAPREFVQAIERIRHDREVLIVTLSGALSGTYKSARSAIELVDHPRVELFDSHTTSIGTGMMVVNAARLSAMGADMSTLLAWLGRWREDTGMLFSLQTLEFLRRGGRIGTASSIFGNLLGLRPVLTFVDGMVRPLARARGREAAYRRLVASLDERLAPGSRIRLGLVCIRDDAGMLARVEAHLANRLRVVEIHRGAPTGVVGAHAGPGAWGVFYQKVRDDDPLL